ncbi:MAG: hypothetical protein DRG78_16985 [Epsilonproteobacteria bacterium]|nr:MAG: hypothetical protein DRG78_16985 [Campylobacterota bacterium]
MAELCLCCNEDATTYHIYECNKTINDCNLTNAKNAKCNHMERLKPTCLVSCKNENDMRIKVAELANNGKEICGICVSTLYKNS